MTEPDIIEADAVDIVDHHEHTPSTELAPRQRRSEVIRPLDADQLIASFQAYQNLLPRLLDASDYQDAGRGKRFVKKSGWRKIATAFDLDVQLIRSDIERDEHGQPARAEVWARAIAPSGRSMDGDGYCSVDEERFSGPRGNKSKLENDLRATATTRAMNRAISGLVGMGEVSAEEVDAGPTPVKADPPFGDALPPEHNKRVGQAIYTLINDPMKEAEPDVGAVVTQIIEDAGGYFPKIVGRAILRLELALLAPLPDDEQEPAGEGT